MKTLSLKPFFLAGVQHADSHLLDCEFAPGTFLTVTHDAENRYDPFALRVTLENTVLGHIPRTDQACWFYHTMQNVNVQCVIVKHDRDQPPYKQIEVEFVCADSYSTVVISLSKPLTE